MPARPLDLPEAPHYHRHVEEEKVMTKKDETKTTQLPEKEIYEKPAVETEEVLERQVLGTGLTGGDPMCA